MASEQRERRRQRKPRLDSALKMANKAGVAVASATIAPDGSISLTFGTDGATTQQSGTWDAAVIELARRQGKRR